MKFYQFIKKFKLDLLCLIILTLTAPFFFYKLGQTSLGSWDEAWYATMARNMVESGNIFVATANDKTFWDHPMGGIWLIAISYKLLGISEFTTRLPSALLGISSLYLVYFLGKKLFNRVVGFSAALAFASTFWFVFRARSGNLDIPLVFFFLVTVYLALQATDKKKFFLPFSICLGFLTTIKSALPFAILPTLFLIFWKNKLYEAKDFIKPILFIFLFFGVWIILLLIADPLFVKSHFLHSSRNASLDNNFLQSLREFLEYLHNGIGKWYWPGVLGILAGLVTLQKRFYILSLFFISYSLPFVTSPQVEIWHLIPLYPLMILAFFGFSYIAGSRLLSLLHFKRYKEIIISIFLIAFSVYFAIFQLRMIWYQFVDIPAYISDEAILSREASKYPYPLAIDSDFIPSAAFYSEKKVEQYSLGSLKSFFEREEKQLLITYEWRLESSQIPKDVYQILKKDRDKLLILKL